MVPVRHKKSRFNRQAAARAVSVIENLKHSTGEYAGKPFRLRDWQKRDIIEPLFGTLNPDGTRQYRTCYVEIPRKNGKTELGAGVAIYLVFFDGEPGAQVYSAAGDRMQASLVYQAAVPMVKQAPALNRIAKIIDSTKTITYPAANSYYRVLSAEAYSKHGINAHGVLFDELHNQPDRELWDVLTTSQGARRQPLIFVMTTAGYDRNSIGWEIHDYACKVRDGAVEDPTFLALIYAAGDDDDWTDERVWKKCNPALGEFRNLDEMRMLGARARETPALEMTFRRLYLNQWVNSAERWMPMERWDACKEKIDLEALRGRPCYAGIDLASRIDLTALCYVFPEEDGRFTVVPHFWLPEEEILEKEKRDRVNYRSWARRGYLTLTPGNVVDYRYITRQVQEDATKYDIREIAFDPWNSQQIVIQLQEDGFTVVEFRQGFKSLSPPTKSLMELVLDRKIRHSGQPVLRWNIDNLVVTQDPAGNLKPDKAKSTQKIDGAVAMIMALDRAIRHQGEGPSIYETEGVLAL